MAALDWLTCAGCTQCKRTMRTCAPSSASHNITSYTCSWLFQHCCITSKDTHHCVSIMALQVLRHDADISHNQLPASACTEQQAVADFLIAFSNWCSDPHTHNHAFDYQMPVPKITMCNRLSVKSLKMRCRLAPMDLVSKLVNHHASVPLYNIYIFSEVHASCVCRDTAL